MPSRYARILLSFTLVALASAAHAQPLPTDKAAAEPAPGAPVPAPASPKPARTTPATRKAPPAAAVPATQPPAPAPVVLPPPAFQLAPPQLYAPPSQAAQPAFYAPQAGEAPLYAPPTERTAHKQLRPKRRYGNAGAPFALGLGANVCFRNEVAYKKLDAADHQTEFEIFASYDVYQPLRRLVLAAGLSYRAATLGEVETLRITSHTLQADLILRYTLARWFFPQLRAGAGIGLSRAELNDESADFRASDRTLGAAGSVGAGFTLQTPRRLFETHRGRLASLSFGLLVEGGYAFLAPSAYRLKVRSDSDLDSSRIALGKLTHSSPYLRILVVMRF